MSRQEMDERAEQAGDVTFTDITVRTRDPQYLDETLAKLPMVLVQVIDNSWDGDTCQVRVLAGDPGFVKFAINSQGYGEVVD